MIRPLKCPRCKSGVDLRVVTRHGNYSAFNGYHFTYSPYSEVRCWECGHPWRTKAQAVNLLPDACEVWQPKT